MPLIKYLTRDARRPGLLQLVNYVFEGTKSVPDDRSFHLLHNVSGITTQEIAKQFREHNKQYLKIRKSKTVGVYHIIISWHVDEKEKLNDTTLRAFAEKFVGMNPSAMYVIRAHYERDNIHLHVIQSATEYGSRTSMRLSKAELKHLQQEINRFQQERFPELDKSVLYLDERKREKVSDLGIPLPSRLEFKSDGEYRIKRRKKKTHKEILRTELASLCRPGMSEAAFLQAVEQHAEIELYQRGKHKGVIWSGRKFRLKTLGIDPQNLREFTRMARLEKLQATHLVKEQEK